MVDEQTLSQYVLKVWILHLLILAVEMTLSAFVTAADI